MVRERAKGVGEIGVRFFSVKCQVGEYDGRVYTAVEEMSDDM